MSKIAKNMKNPKRQTKVQSVFFFQFSLFLFFLLWVFGDVRLSVLLSNLFMWVRRWFLGDVFVCGRLFCVFELMF